MLRSESEINAPTWEADDRITDEVHREMRETEFYGLLLGRMREYARIFPKAPLGKQEFSHVSALMECGDDNEILNSMEETCTVRDFKNEFGWPRCVSLIASACRELEREQGR